VNRGAELLYPSRKFLNEPEDSKNFGLGVGLELFPELGLELLNDLCLDLCLDLRLEPRDQRPAVDRV